MNEIDSAKTTVLVIDDERAIRTLLRRTLEGEGYQCLEAGNAEQALEVLKQNQIALVLLDINMPGKSGVELLPQIRAAYPNTSIIMATAVSDVSIAVECMKHGAYDYVTKPFNLEGVLRSVDHALEKRRLELEIEEYRHHLEEKVTEQAKKIHAFFLNAMTALVQALEAKDDYTSGHSRRVAEIATAIAQELKLSPESVERIKSAGLLHDIGKIGVKESILNKPSRLTAEEFQHISKHAEVGERILSPIVDDTEILKLVRGHHERFNGNGYPDGINCTGMSLGIKILAVADAYEAMTSARPYREAMSDEAACAELERCKETQFDPEVVDAFLRTRKTTNLSFHKEGTLSGR